ncbi:hypothetical protein DYU05_05740 [Mucilaginibacter terrenus]|uniref:Uncharacterized protein n=1 Tax=Mucilaginibacter terrenus TaxID=2482727 RepID=A0A3E2NVR0_9SPHI|nr:hypothetical protein [Mucilaginibacter terrenus]RFZ85103.1 hypothetical protein DYU05_05740 [Mucilaginibacter terrenus]
MKTQSNDNSSSTAINDKIAQVVSAYIVSVQVKMATAIAGRFNAYSAPKQKLVLLSIVAITIAILLAGLFTNSYTIPALHQSYKPATHIGMASDVNLSGRRDAQLTDSLTKK